MRTEPQDGSDLVYSWLIFLVYWSLAAVSLKLVYGMIYVIESFPFQLNFLSFLLSVEGTMLS
jgi:hypothetical protein